MTYCNRSGVIWDAMIDGQGAFPNGTRIVAFGGADDHGAGGSL
jgi:hypothetical protein